MNRKDLHAMVGDPTLSPDALRVVLYVHSLGPGAHPVSTQVIDSLLQTRTSRVRQRAVRTAVSSGHVTRIPGGWGKPAIYEATDRVKSTLSVDPTQSSLDLSPSTPDSVESTPSRQRTTEERRTEEVESTLSATTEEVESTLSRPLTESNRLSQRARGRELLGVEGSSSKETDAHEEHALHFKVEKILTEEGWNGFRGALADYLRDRVPTERQLYYVMTVRTWLQGAPSAPRGLLRLPTKDQHLLIASALNELLQLEPDDEKTQFRSSRGQSGKTHLLRTKLEYLITRGGPDAKAVPGRPAASGRTSPARAAPRSGIGDNFTGFPEDD